MTVQPEDLAVDVERRDDTVVLTAHGVLDYFHSGILRDPLDEAVQRAGALVVLDLSGVTFVDSTGLALLLTADQAARRSGARLRLACPAPQLRRMLDTTNLTRRFALHDTVAAALQAE